MSKNNSDSSRINISLFKSNKLREFDYEIHLKRIEAILTEVRKPKYAKFSSKFQEIHNSHFYAHKLAQKEKNYQIRKKNESLIKRIVAIEFSPSKNQINKQSPLKNKENESILALCRKKNQDKINRENMEIGRRLINQLPALPLSDIEKHKSKYLALRHVLQKNKGFYANPPQKSKKKEDPYFPKILKEMQTFQEEDSNHISIDEHLEKKESNFDSLVVIVKSIEICNNEDYKSVFIKCFGFDQCKISEISTSNNEGKSFSLQKGLIFKKILSMNSKDLFFELWGNKRFEKEEFIGISEMMIEKEEIKSRMWLDVMLEGEIVGKIFVILEWKKENLNKKKTINF